MTEEGFLRGVGEDVGWGKFLVDMQRKYSTEGTTSVRERVLTLGDTSDVRTLKAVAGRRYPYSGIS